MREQALKLLAVVLGRMSETQVERVFGSPVALRAIFSGMARSFEPEAAQGFEGVLAYELTRPRTQQPPAVWSLEIKNGKARARSGALDGADLTLRLHLSDFMRIAARMIDPAVPLLAGRGNIYGSLELAARLPEMFGAPPMR